MTTTESVIESLAAKLATADLNDAEVELLQSLLTEPDEVAGFASKDWTSILSIGVATKGVSWPGTTGSSTTRRVRTSTSKAPAD